jgi:hypothetical protein
MILLQRNQSVDTPLIWVSETVKLFYFVCHLGVSLLSERIFKTASEESKTAIFWCNIWLDSILVEATNSKRQFYNDLIMISAGRRSLAGPQNCTHKVSKINRIRLIGGQLFYFVSHYAAPLISLKPFLMDIHPGGQRVMQLKPVQPGHLYGDIHRRRNGNEARAAHDERPSSSVFLHFSIYTFFRNRLLQTNMPMRLIRQNHILTLIKRKLIGTQLQPTEICGI